MPQQVWLYSYYCWLGISDFYTPGSKGALRTVTKSQLRKPERKVVKERISLTTRKAVSKIKSTGNTNKTKVKKEKIKK